MPQKPNIISQLTAQTGMDRLGGMASKAASPVPQSLGSKTAAMENAMLKRLKPKPKPLAMSKGGRQFKKLRSEEGNS